MAQNIYFDIYPVTIHLCKPSGEEGPSNTVKKKSSVLLIHMNLYVCGFGFQPGGDMGHLKVCTPWGNTLVKQCSS